LLKGRDKKRTRNKGFRRTPWEKSGDQGAWRIDAVSISRTVEKNFW